NIHGGHWGDFDIIVPEEEIILNKLNSVKNTAISINEIEARIILGWSDSTFGIHTMEESSVIKKIKSVLTSNTGIENHE
ncbi:MAG: hypothetical protein ACW963_05390, partial [Candidatus Sifarchaeia archaeon]